MTEEYFRTTDTVNYSVPEGAMTMQQAGRIFRLDPAPPKVEDINEYIVSAIRESDNTYFTYFLHHYEPRLNRWVRRFMLREGIDRYDPERFLDYKLSCVLAMMECLQRYEPDSGADFLTYAHNFIGSAMLNCRRYEEAGSFSSLKEYRNARGIAWLYNNSDKSEKEVISEYAAKENCREETAAEYLTLAKQNRSRVPFYSTIQDEDSEETGEDVTCDDSWNYADILWNGIRAKDVQAAFDKLSYKEQTLLEKRNALCMTCGRTAPMTDRASFEELAIMFEGSSASGAERAYKRALNKLTKHLVEVGVLGIVELTEGSRHTGIPGIIYEYRAIHRFANDDDKPGEIRVSLRRETADILRFADGDNWRTIVYAEVALRYLQQNMGKKLPKKISIPFELEMEKLRYGD